MDESVVAASVNVDLTLKILGLSHAIKVAVPISYTPGFPQGDFALTAGPDAANSVSSPVSATGTVKVNDAKSEELFCVNIDSTSQQIGLINV